MTAPLSAGSSPDLPSFIQDLGERLGARRMEIPTIVKLSQHGRMKRALGSNPWMAFKASQTISIEVCAFDWRARFGPCGLVSVCDALHSDVGRLDVMALGFIPLARTAPTPALARGELMRYLAELAWAPDAILNNASLRWRVTGPDTVTVGAGTGESAATIMLSLDAEGRITEAYASDRPRSDKELYLPTPWRGRFSDYRKHLGRWLPFAGEVAWVIDGKEETYWQGQIRTLDIV